MSPLPPRASGDRMAAATLAPVSEVAPARVPLGRPGPDRHRFEWLWWLLSGTIVAVVMTWPLVRHLSTSIPQDLGDPLGQAWFLAWGGHALLTAPLHLFQGN